MTVVIFWPAKTLRLCQATPSRWLLSYTQCEQRVLVAQRKGYVRPRTNSSAGVAGAV